MGGGFHARHDEEINMYTGFWLTAMNMELENQCQGQRVQTVAPGLIYNPFSSGCYVGLTLLPSCCHTLEWSKSDILIYSSLKDSTVWDQAGVQCSSLGREPDETEHFPYGRERSWLDVTWPDRDEKKAVLLLLFWCHSSLYLSTHPFAVDTNSSGREKWKQLQQSQVVKLMKRQGPLCLNKKNFLSSCFQSLCLKVGGVASGTRAEKRISSHCLLQRPFPTDLGRDIFELSFLDPDFPYMAEAGQQLIHENTKHTIAQEPYKFQRLVIFQNWNWTETPSCQFLISWPNFPCYIFPSFKNISTCQKKWQKYKK